MKVRSSATWTLIAALLTVGVLSSGASATKSWSQLRALFPGQPGQPTSYLGTGNFRLLLDGFFPLAVDGVDPRFFYHENFVQDWDTKDGTHRLDFWVNYQDTTEFGSIVYSAAVPFGPYIEVSVELDDKNQPIGDCKYNLESLPDILSPEFWEFTTGFGAPIAYVGERDFRGIKCDYFEGVIPAGNGAPETTIGWYNRKTSDTDIEKYAPVQYFLGVASFEQTRSHPNPTNKKIKQMLTNIPNDNHPGTALCDSTLDAFFSGQLQSRDTATPEERALHQAQIYLASLTQE